MHLLLSVALSFTYTRRLMTTLAPTKENPTLWTFRNWVTFTQYHEGIWTKRNFQFGNGQKGRPAHLRTAWAQPDAFIKRYTFEQWEEGEVVENGKTFTASDGEIYSPLRMKDGYEIDAEIVAEFYESFQNRMKSVGRAKKPKLSA